MDQDDLDAIILSLNKESSSRLKKMLNDIDEAYNDFMAKGQEHPIIVEWAEQYNLIEEILISRGDL